MSKAKEAMWEEAGYIWDTCHIMLSKQYSGAPLDDRSKQLIESMGKAAENLLMILGDRYDR